MTCGTSLSHKAVGADHEAAVGGDAARDTPALRCSADARRNVLATATRDTALVVRAAVEHAQRHGLADAAGEIRGIRLDLDGLLAETVAGTPTPAGRRLPRRLTSRSDARERCTAAPSPTPAAVTPPERHAWAGWSIAMASSSALAEATVTTARKLRRP
jgi:hypothetical protein